MKRTHQENKLLKVIDQHKSIIALIQGELENVRIKMGFFTLEITKKDLEYVVELEMVIKPHLVGTIPVVETPPEKLVRHYVEFKAQLFNLLDNQLKWIWVKEGIAYGYASLVLNHNDIKSIEQEDFGFRLELSSVEPKGKPEIILVKLYINEEDWLEVILQVNEDKLQEQELEQLISSLKSSYRKLNRFLS